jgi:hypothetical protein
LTYPIGTAGVILDYFLVDAAHDHPAGYGHGVRIRSITVLIEIAKSFFRYEISPKNLNPP